MPYLADGTFSPDMQMSTSGAPVNALAQPLPPQPMADDPTIPQPPPGMEAPSNIPFSKQTGQPRYEADRKALGFAGPGGGGTDVLKGMPKPNTKAAAPGFAQMKVPSFLEYAQFAAKRDSTPDAAIDPATMPDSSYIKYAKEYADTMLPQALLSAGHKVTPEYLKTLTPNFAYQTAQNADKLRDHFKGQKPPPDPNAPLPDAPSEGYDWLKQLGAKATEIGSSALAGVARTLSDPRILAGPMGQPLAELASRVSPKAHAFFDAMDAPRNAVADKMAAFGAKTGEAITSTESKGFQEKSSQPFLHPDQPWITPEGGLNPKKLNANSLNLPNLVGKGENVLLPLIAFAATRDPVAAASAFGLQGSESSRQAEMSRLGALTQEQWQQVPAYVHKVHDGMDDETAKTQVVNESAKMQQMIGAAGGALTGLAGGLPWFKPAASGFLSRILKNYAVQAPSFAALSAGQQAAGNIGKNIATGTNTPIGEGTGEAAITGAVTAIPFAPFGNHETPAAKPKPGAPEAGAVNPADPGGVNVGTSTPAQEATNYAFDSHPPPKAPFTSPAQAQSHYAQSLAAFKGELRGKDFTPEQVTGMVPEFDAEWTKATGHDPKTGLPVPAPGEAPPGAPVDEVAEAAAKAPPDGSEPPAAPGAPEAPAQGGLDLGAPPSVDLGGPRTVAEAATAREAVAADHLSDGMRKRVTADLTKSLGREPSNSEVAKQAGHLMDIALGQEGIDKSIPQPALEEALGDLMAKSNKFPDVDEINKLAREKAANPNQEKITYQDSLNLNPDKGSDVLKKGFDKIAAREAKERAAALKQKKADTIKAQDIENDEARRTREKEINDAYDARVKEAGEQSQKERDNAHATAERERGIAEQAEREADEADKRDARKGKAPRQNVLKKNPLQEAQDRATADDVFNKVQDPLAKKDEPVAVDEDATGTHASKIPDAAKETAPGHPYEGWMRREATPEEAAGDKQLEDFYKQFKNVGSMLEGLRKRLKNSPMLEKVIDRLFSNPYVRDILNKTKLTVHNPGDARTPHSDEIGSYQTYFKNEKGEMEYKGYSTMGLYSKIAGVILAGKNWKKHTGYDYGLSPITAVHEAVHAAIAELIRKHEGDLLAGRPVDPVLDAAYQQLQEFRQALKDVGLHTVDKKATPDLHRALKYATTDVHELISVALTDPRVQKWLQNTKMGQVTAWKKLVGIVSKFLGIGDQEKDALSHIMEQANKFIDHKPADYENPVQRNSAESPENLGDVLYSRQSDRVAENTPERVMDAIRIKPPKERIAAENEVARTQNKPSQAGKWQTYIFDKLKPLTQAIERLTALGKTVGPRENIETGARVYQNLAARAVNIAQQQFIQPTVQKIVELAGKSGHTSEEFLTHLSAWYFGKRALEVNQRGELEHARLRNDAEVKRQAIRDDWAAGKIGPGEYLDKLREVVDAPGARVENRSPLSKSGIDDETAHELISRARKNGITQSVVDEFDPYRQRMLEEIDRNYQRSGRFSTFDAARKKALGSKWYVPLKGFGEAGDEMGSSGLGAFTREYTGASGRTTIARNPLVNLMQEVQGSARDVPENGLTKIVYDFAKKYGKEFGIKIRTMDVEKEVQDAIAAGGTVGDADRAFKNPQTVIHNNGEYRYSIEFPEGSEILDALKSINESRELNTFERTAGTVTNIISRGATTLNPKFLLWNAFWRDTGYVGAQIGMDLGPQAMAEYAARYWLQGGPLRGRATYFKNFVQPRNSLERDAFAATGKSKFAQSLAELAKYGGDLSFDNELNTVRNLDTVYDALKKASGENLSVRDKFEKMTDPLIHFLDQIGTSDIMTARVAAYETYEATALKKLGHAPTDAEAVQIKKDAAMFSRRVLDYQQRSDLSRSLNVVFPFARVVMTQTDRLLTTFKNPDGSYNLKKVAVMTAIGLMAGATYYSLLRQASPDIKKQENSTLAQNFVIPVGDSVVRIPMAYGLTRLFLVPGMMMARAMFGDTSDEDATNEIRNALAEGFLPFRPPEAQHNEKFHDEVMDLVTAMTPGAVRPFLEIERNKNVFGAQITPMDDRTKGPHSQAGFNGTPEMWKWAAKNLHDFTGGAVDVYPESLEYLTGAYGTGPGNAIMRAAAIHTKGSDDLNAQKLPFVPAITSRDAEFYERREIENLKSDLENEGKPLPKDESKREPGVTYLTAENTELLHEINASGQKFGRQRAALYKNSLLSKSARTKALEDVGVQQRAEQAEILKKSRSK